MNTIIISDDVKVNKPDTRIFELALADIKSKAQSALFIGDHPLNDIKSANEAGFTTVWISCGRSWNIAGYSPDDTISSLSELISIIK